MSDLDMKFAEAARAVEAGEICAAKVGLYKVAVDP
jgi:hypothetical protein